MPPGCTPCGAARILSGNTLGGGAPSGFRVRRGQCDASSWLLLGSAAFLRQRYRPIVNVTIWLSSCTLWHSYDVCCFIYSRSRTSISVGTALYRYGTARGILEQFYLAFGICRNDTDRGSLYAIRHSVSCKHKIYRHLIPKPSLPAPVSPLSYMSSSACSDRQVTYHAALPQDEGVDVIEASKLQIPQQRWSLCSDGTVLAVDKHYVPANLSFTGPPILRFCIPHSHHTGR